MADIEITEYIDGRKFTSNIRNYPDEQVVEFIPEWPERQIKAIRKRKVGVKAAYPRCSICKCCSLLDGICLGGCDLAKRKRHAKTSRAKYRALPAAPEEKKP